VSVKIISKGPMWRYDGPVRLVLIVGPLSTVLDTWSFCRLWLSIQSIIHFGWFYCFTWWSLWAAGDVFDVDRTDRHGVVVILTSTDAAATAGDVASATVYRWKSNVQERDEPYILPYIMENSEKTAVGRPVVFRAGQS